MRVSARDSGTCPGVPSREAACTYRDWSQADARPFPSPHGPGRTGVRRASEPRPPAPGPPGPGPPAGRRPGRGTGKRVTWHNASLSALARASLRLPPALRQAESESARACQWQRRHHDSDDSIMMLTGTLTPGPFRVAYTLTRSRSLARHMTRIPGPPALEPGPLPDSDHTVTVRVTVPLATRLVTVRLGFRVTGKPEFNEST